MKDLVKDTLSGGIVAVASLSENPIAIVATSLGAPVLSSVAVDFASRMLSSWQSTRFAEGCNLIAEKIGQNINSGKLLRSDDGMCPVNGEQAQQVLEGILQNIADEYERKKIEAHTNLFTNLCFDERIVFEQALYLTRVLKQLSYRQLVIIAIFNQSPMKVGNWSFRFEEYSENYIFKSRADLYCEIKDLEQKVIIEDANPIATYEGSTHYMFKLSAFGKLIFNELDLSTIPKEDIDEISKMLIIHD